MTKKKVTRLIRFSVRFDICELIDFQVFSNRIIQNLDQISQNSILNSEFKNRTNRIYLNLTDFNRIYTKYLKIFNKIFKIQTI